jgi:hypothetical protein
MAGKLPMTWDADGRLVPLDDRETTRQREIIAQENPFQPDTPRFRVMTRQEMRRERAARVVRSCRSTLASKFDPPFEFIAGPRSAVLMMFVTVVFVICFIFLIVAALIYLPIAEARLRKIDALIAEPLPVPER